MTFYDKEKAGKIPRILFQEYHVRVLHQTMDEKLNTAQCWRRGVVLISSVLSVNELMNKSFNIEIKYTVYMTKRLLKFELRYIYKALPACKFWFIKNDFWDGLTLSLLDESKLIRKDN